MRLRPPTLRSRRLRSRPRAAASSKVLTAACLVFAGASPSFTAACAAQEPAPIPAGVAPPPGPYAPGVDVVHYDVEIGLGSGTDWFAGVATLQVAVEAPEATLPLDFTGLEITRVTLAGSNAAYTRWLTVLGMLAISRMSRYS